MRLRDIPVLNSRLVGAISIVLGILGVLSVVTVPLDPGPQALLAVVGFCVYLVANRFKGRGVTIFLVLLSTAVSIRYIFWRITDTMDYVNIWQTFLGYGLLLAEIYAIVALLLAYFQTIWPLDRKPTPLPNNPDEWPVVDIYVPTYNEALEIVKPTVFAALAIDWPPEKMNVYILDDGRREEFRLFAEECGANYIIRPDNKGAKAGNINHALTKTKGEFIAIFDCDHAATRGFLQLTLGWLLRDPKLAMVQTPHYFYSPDPFERNLASGRKVPNEGLLFYGLVQPGNDFWDATFFCGSCAVIRRTALEEVGGVPTITVTEDCHCSLRMQKRGWRTAYLRAPLAAGLATERLIGHIGQRVRWARGMVQIMRLENPLFGRGLRLSQRLCYFMAMFHYLFPLPRFVFLTSPLAFLLFGQNIIAASPLAILAYAGPHIVHSVVTSSRMQGKVRHSFWSEIYEAVLALYLVPVTLATLIDPRKGKFNVTDKGGTLQEGYFDLRAVGPNMVLAAVLLLAVSVGAYGLWVNPPGSLEFQAFLLNIIWAVLCFTTVLGGLAVGRERRQVRERARIPAHVRASVVLPDGRVVPGVTRDLSLGGAALLAEAAQLVDAETLVHLRLDLESDTVTIPAEVLRWQNDRLQVRFVPQDLKDEGLIVRAVLGRADNWTHWDKTRPDFPLLSLWEVVRSVAGLFGGGSQFSLKRRRRGAGGPRGGNPPAAGAPRADRSRLPAAGRTAAALLLGVLLFAGGPAEAQRRHSAQPNAAQPAADPAGQPLIGPNPARDRNSSPAVSDPLLQIPPANVPMPSTATPFGAPTALSAGAGDDGTRQVTRTLRQLGLTSPMQLRGTSDLQGVLFGVRGDEVVTSAKLTLEGATSPALIPELSQIAITLNEQFVGTVQPDKNRPSFGPLEFNINPVFFTDTNRLNFRFSGRYAVECNDPLSGLLWSTVSDLSTLQLTMAKLLVARDLSRLPEPFFDPRVRDQLVLPFVMLANPSNEVVKAATVVSSWFAVQADYRGATFPVQSQLPQRGNAIVVVTGTEGLPDLALPAFEGPTLALVPNPNDRFGMLLVVGGRTAAEAEQAADALAVGHEALSGELATVQAPQLAPRHPYDAPRWVQTDKPIRFGDIVDPSELQASGYSPGEISIPFRTAPDLYSWHNRPFPVDIHFRAPPGPIVDVRVSRLDVALNNVYLRSLPLAAGQAFWPWSWVLEKLGKADVNSGEAGLPPWMVFGQNNLQLHFDMRPLSRGDCAAVPGDVHASIDPNSTFDLSRAYHFATLPSLAMFASAGFPFTRLADLSDTAVVLPDSPSASELSATLGLVGHLASIIGYPATGLQVVRAQALSQAAGRNLIVVGTLGHQSALPALLRDAPLAVEGNRLTVSLPTALDRIRSVFGTERERDRDRVSATLAQPGDSLGALMAFESPLHSGKSVVALTGATGNGLEAMLAAFSDAKQLPNIKGDVVLLNGGQVCSYHLGASYTVGTLPFWIWPQYWAANNPWKIMAVFVIACVAMAIPIYWLLRRRAARRLRMRV